MASVRLSATQEMRVVKQSLSNIRHDARNRISSLKLTLHILERQNTPELQPQITLMKQQLDDLNRLLEQTKDLFTKN